MTQTGEDLQITGGGYDAYKLMADIYGTGLDGRLEELVSDRVLPPDTMMRLSPFGAQMPDLDSPTGELIRKRVSSRIIELVANSDSELPSDEDPEVANLDLVCTFNEDSEIASSDLEQPFDKDREIKKILFGEAPDIMFNYGNLGRSALRRVTKGYTYPVYSKAHLAAAVRQRRRIEGKTLAFGYRDKSQGRYWSEGTITRGLAHAVFRTILEREKPDWMTDEGVRQFSIPDITKTSRGVNIRLDHFTDKTMRNELVASAVFSEKVIREILVEAHNEGVKGLGPVGKLDLRWMLARNYREIRPDIMPIEEWDELVSSRGNLDEFLSVS